MIPSDMWSEMGEDHRPPTNICSRSTCGLIVSTKGMLLLVIPDTGVSQKDNLLCGPSECILAILKRWR